MSGEATIRQLDRDMRPKRVIDIRGRDSFVRGSYPGAENIPLEEFDADTWAICGTGC